MMKGVLVLAAVGGQAGVVMAQTSGGSSLEDALKSAMGQVPALVVLVVLAIYFLKAMGAKDAQFADAQAKSRQDYLESLKGLMTSHQQQWSAIHADQLQARKEIQGLIERQLEAMKTMAAAMATCPVKHG